MLNEERKSEACVDCGHSLKPHSSPRAVRCGPCGQKYATTQWTKRNRGRCRENSRKRYARNRDGLRLAAKLSRRLDGVLPRSSMVAHLHHSYRGGKNRPCIDCGKLVRRLPGDATYSMMTLPRCIRCKWKSQYSRLSVNCAGCCVPISVTPSAHAKVKNGHFCPDCLKHFRADLLARRNRERKGISKGRILACVDCGRYRYLCPGAIPRNVAGYRCRACFEGSRNNAIRSSDVGSEPAPCPLREAS